MLITLRRKYLLKIGEVYFTPDYKQKVESADIVAYLHSLKPCEGASELYTLHIDLSQSKEKLFSGISKRTRRRINTAINKDCLDYLINCSPTDQEIKKFAVFYNIFARNKGIGKCNPNKLKALRDEKGLFISTVRNKKGENLCYHAYLGDTEFTRILYSASHFRLSEETAWRNLIGRANRFLHWMDLNYFKDQGFLIYDFGGLALNTENEVLNNIDRFKLGFGGKILSEYAFYQSQNVWGSLALKFRDYKVQRGGHGSKIYLSGR